MNGDVRDGHGRRGGRERRTSNSTYQTEKTERFELEESSEFLQPIQDRLAPSQNILDELEYQGLEETQTRLHPPTTNTHFSYNR